jgi:hypothetical protein
MGSASSRYDEAVTKVAGEDPVLGFRLRSQDLILPVLAQLRQLAASDPQALSAWPALESALRTKVTPSLEERILDVAWLHGKWT